MEPQHLELIVNNDPTVLLRVIQVLKRRRINIRKLVAEDLGNNEAVINICVEADEEQVRQLRPQFRRLVDVMTVNWPQPPISK